MTVASPPADMSDLAEAIPDPKTVRTRLDQNRREASFLRRLLKLSLEAQKAQGGGGEDNVNAS